MSGEMGDGNYYTSLLEIGLHPMSLEAVRALCVDDPRFAMSGRRGQLMENLETLIGGLRQIGIKGNIWIDGSFLTEKVNPRDVDILLYLDDPTVQAFSPGQKADVDWLIENKEIKDLYDCDSHVHVSFPEGHSAYDFGVWMHAYWLRLFGWDEFLQMKGIAVVSL
jgi:hypothetical protein